jgi:hypothetical protein
MRGLLVRATVLLLLVAFARAELIVNGGFDEPLSVGWSDTVWSAAGSYNIERSDTFNPLEPGFAAQVYKCRGYFTTLYQTVDVPSADLALSFDGRLYLWPGAESCWPAPAFIIRYQDAAGTELGNTKFYKHNIFCTWQSSDTAHLIDVTSQWGWKHYQLDLGREIRDSLPGVDPAAVRKVRVELHAFVSGT